MLRFSAVYNGSCFSDHFERLNAGRHFMRQDIQTVMLRTQKNIVTAHFDMKAVFASAASILRAIVDANE
ncbi:hypothetical protein CQ054_21480 [Ochrobactrum sp. MYb29]|nr:hypothetical protein CQ054_21480 [Ochrobactrum sp. MYb29]